MTRPTSLYQYELTPRYGRKHLGALRNEGERKIMS